MNDEVRKDILLETGTNEVELAEFLLGKQSFGVNVAKIREFVPYLKKSVTKVPNSHPSMDGVFLLRGKTIPLINLNFHLQRKVEEIPERPVVLVTEFNNLINGFRIDAINQIHRLSWNDIKPLNPLISRNAPRLTGTVHIKGTEILILDLEFIISEIFPGKMKELTEYESKTQSKEEQDQKIQQRSDVKIIIAEDSTMIRTLIKNAVNSEGYTNLHLFDNGKDAYNYCVKLQKQAGQENRSINNYLNIIVSDIEMPQMDGLTLCKKIKDELRFRNIPVILFSSLINEQMVAKCKAVGADSFISKPQMAKLVSMIDKYMGLSPETETDSIE